MSFKPLHTRIDKVLHRKVKHQSIDLDISLASAVTEALLRYLAIRKVAVSAGPADERVQLYAHIPEELHALITRHCKETELDLEDVLTAALTAWLDEKKTGQPR